MVFWYTYCCYSVCRPTGLGRSSRGTGGILMTADEPVTVAHYPFRPAAEAARLSLDAEGIPTFLSDAEIVDMDWLLGNALGWIKLQVPAVDAERATEILRRVEERRLTRRWRRSPGPFVRRGDSTMADEDEMDDLERQLYGLRLHVATIYRLLTSKGICTPDEIQAMIEKVDAEDGASDEEFFGDVIGPPSGEP
jgi:hypothetical protein